ncbi:PEP-CTERM sorting domain-containing protein [Planctomycetota bacterium]
MKRLLTICAVTGMILAMSGTALGQIIELDMLDATVEPAGNPGGRFGVIDVTGVYGTPGAGLYLDSAQISLWTDSGDPAANMGSIDMGTGAFALNWAAEIGLEVYDAGVGGTLIGFAQINVVMPETGLLDPGTGIVSSATASPVMGSLILKDLFDNPILLGDTIIGNCNNCEVTPAAFGEFDGVFLPDSPCFGPEIDFRLPGLGDQLLYAELSGTFHLTPEPATIAVLSIGALALIRKRQK